MTNRTKLTPQQVKEFLHQFAAARDRIALYPKWMQDAAHTKTACFPRTQDIRNERTS